MLQAHRQIFKRLNIDVDPAMSKPDEYVYLKNGVPFQHPRQDGGDGAISSVWSNYRQANADLTTGAGVTNRVIGKFDDILHNRTIHFVYNSLGDHAIYIMDSVFTITRVIKNALLGFSLNFPIDGVFVFGDLCIWTDNNVDIREINLAKAIAGGTYTPTLEEITLIKRPPQLTLDLHYSTDVGFANNYITHNFFQFYYRYIYTDNEASVWSQFGQKPDNSQGTNNRIEISLKGGEVIPKTVKQIDYAVRINQASEVTVYLSEAVAGGVHPIRHYFYNDSIGETIPDNQSFKWNDFVPLKSKALGFHKNRLFFFHNTEGYNYKATPISGIVLGTSTSAFPFKSQGNYQIGIMFFDFAGRHAGVQVGVTSTITIPDRDNNALPQYTITWDISAVASADIPLWATHYSIVRTKDRIRSFFIQDKTADIFYYKKDAAGAITYNKVYSVDNTGIVVDISQLPKYFIGYTFNKGDRIRIYMQTLGGVQLAPQDLEIRSQDGRFLFVDLFNVGNVMTTTAATNLIFEVYTPQKPISPTLFFECDERYTIINPGSGAQTFGVTSGTLRGDIAFPNTTDRPTTYKYQFGGGYNPTAPYSNTMIADTNIVLEAMNESSRYFDTWTDGTGRSTAFSRIGSLQQEKTNYLRFGQTYLFNAQVSQLNTFEPFDEYPLPLENGPGTALAVNDRVLVAIHEKETEAIYIGEGFVSTSTANQFLAKTDNVVGDDNKYIGGYGTCHAESVIVYADRTYYFDVYKAAIVRRAPDGLTAISNYGIRNFLKKYQQDNNLIVNKALLKCYGGYDPLLDLCLWSFTFNSVFSFCVAFHEASNSWVSFFDYPCEGFSKLNGNLVGYKNGEPHIHYGQGGGGNNRFYGVQYNRLLEFNLAPNMPKVHVWKSIALDQDNTNLTDAIPIAELSDNGIGYVNSGLGVQISTISRADLINREGVWRSAIFRNTNTPLRNLVFDIDPPTFWTTLFDVWDTLTGTEFVKTFAPGVGVGVQSYQGIPSTTGGTYTFRLTAILSNFTDPTGSITITVFAANGFHVLVGSSVSNQGPLTKDGIYQFEFTIEVATGGRLELRVDKNFAVGNPTVVINISPTIKETFMKYEGNPMRSQILKVKMACDRTDSAVLRAVTILSTPSEIS